MYDSYGKESIKYILNHGKLHTSLFKIKLRIYFCKFLAEIKAVFVDTFKRVKNILEEIDTLSHLKLIVHFNKMSENESREIDEYKKKVEIIDFETLLVVHLIMIFNLYNIFFLDKREKIFDISKGKLLNILINKKYN